MFCILSFTNIRAATAVSLFSVIMSATLLLPACSPSEPFRQPGEAAASGSSSDNTNEQALHTDNNTENSTDSATVSDSNAPDKASDSSGKARDTVYVMPDRPLPRDPAPPAGYQRTVERGHRTGDGRPGNVYWQQFAEYDIDVTLNPENKTLAGTTRITYHNNSPDVLRNLHLELVQNLNRPGVRRNRSAKVTGGVNLHEVVVNGETLTDEAGRSARYSLQGTRMVIRPAEPVQADTTVELEITYDFVIPRQGAGGRMGHSGDNLFYLGYWYPHMTVYDDVVGWHPDPYLGQAEFYHGFADYDLTIRAPENWIIMATGELQNPANVLDPDVLQRWEEAGKRDEPMRIYTAGSNQPATVCALSARESSAAESDTLLAWHYKAENVRDVAFSATRESNWDAARTTVGDRSGDGQTDHTLINSFWRDEAPLWEDVTAYQQHAITFLSDMTGFPYPWPHMTAIEGGGIIGGGMEYPMMTIIGDYNDRGAEALYSVTAHELAHMWVPMIVSTDERHYSWLDEGNTVFSTAEAVMDYLPERRPHTRARNAYARAARTGNEGPMMRRSDYHYSTQQFIIASYRKPAAVLIALRKILGEEQFWEAYREFISEWAFKQAYPWDFFRTFERVSGKDLDWFWYSWYYETWVLDQSVKNVQETEEGTRIVIRDKGDVPMPVYITVTYDGDNKVTYTIPVDGWLKGSRREEIVIPERDVRRVEIDSERELPDINRQNAVWERS